MEHTIVLDISINKAIASFFTFQNCIYRTWAIRFVAEVAHCRCVVNFVNVHCLKNHKKNMTFPVPFRQICVVYNEKVFACIRSSSNIVNVKLDDVMKLAMTYNLLRILPHPSSFVLSQERIYS